MADGNLSRRSRTSERRWRCGAAALADVRDAPWAQAEAARLEQQRLDAVEDLAQARLDAGDARRVAADLLAFVDDHPLRSGRGCCSRSPSTGVTARPRRSRR